MTCVSCLIGLRYVEPLSSLSRHLFSSFCCFFHATYVIHPSYSRRCPLSGTIEACVTWLCSHTFSVGFILQPRGGWIVTSSMLTPHQTNRPKRALASMCMEVTCVACLVFPFSLLRPTLLICSGRASVTATKPNEIQVNTVIQIP